jgi:hypothetical protein
MQDDPSACHQQRCKHVGFFLHFRRVHLQIQAKPIAISILLNNRIKEVTAELVLSVSVSVCTILIQRYGREHESHPLLLITRVSAC